MPINEATGGAGRRAGTLSAPPPPNHPNGWITARNQQFKMKSDLLLETCLSLRRRCVTIAELCTGH
ncbi:MAG: hypothetical protein VB959_14530 [Rhodospirillales bacterium]